MQYNYAIKPLVIRKVRSFYRNVCKKYPNIYSYYDMLRYINKTVDAIYCIEQSGHDGNRQSKGGRIGIWRMQGIGTMHILLTATPSLFMMPVMHRI